MKKFLIIGFAVVALSSVAVMSSVYAQSNGGHMGGNGHMSGNGHMGGNGHMSGGHGCGYGGADSNTPVITEKEAEVKVKEYMKTFKGYKVKNVESFQGRNGHTAFIANVEDASGNKLIVRVSPYGYITGPIMNTNPQ